MSGLPTKGCYECNYTGERVGDFGEMIDCNCQFKRKDDPQISDDAADFLNEAIDQLNIQGRLL